MSSTKLPAIRLPSNKGGECLTPDGFVLDLPPSNKFSVSWPSDGRPAPTPTPPASERQNLSFPENESETSDGESGNEKRDSSDQLEDASPIRTKPQASETPTSPGKLIPRFSRALSMPLPSQLGPLKHPHKSGAVPPRESQSTPDTPPDSSRLHELSVELADSVQMMIQTMLQISPPQLLDPAKEQFSACALSVPTSSMSAMLTTMKNLNYISANMADFCTEIPGAATGAKLKTDVPPPRVPAALTDFDIGEMLQSIGDSLGGAAAEAGVDLVIYHGDDIGLRHVCVRGDESGISYSLSHVVRQVLMTAQHGDSIELGLLIGDPKPERPSALGDVALEEDYASLSPIESEGPLSCTIRISHKFHSSIPVLRNKPTTSGVKSRPQPSFSSLLLRRLLHQIGAMLTSNLPPPKQFVDGRTCDFTLILERGSLSLTNTPLVGDMQDDDPLATEPSVEQLSMFAEGLKGKRVTLYANAKGSFAQHLTSYLTAWGMDVTHVSPDGNVDGLIEPQVISPTTRPTEQMLANGISEQNPSFIFVDDDVEVLKEQLHVLRNEQSQHNFHLRKRPALGPHHRPRSSPQIVRTMGYMQYVPTSTVPVVLVHFTSLANYKVIKDIVQSVVMSHAGSTTPLPEVMIIPKPAGPRRFLTALHTAVIKPVVDPFFVPIATSPSSPGLQHEGSFFHSYHNTETRSRTPAKTRPSGSRSNSDRSTKSQRDIIDHAGPPPPSPLSVTENVEYFSEAAAKLGASPSSGLVIQSPDGQPAGIFFHPRGKTSRAASSTSMERDKGHLHVPTEQRRSKSRLSSDSNSTVTYSSLHAVVSSPKPTIGPATSPSIRASARTPALSQPEENSPTLPLSSPVLPRRSTPADTVRDPTPSASPPSEYTPTIRRAAPRRTAQESAKSPSSALAAASKKVKAAAGDGNIVPPISVLIVDDNPINQTILSTFMKKKKIKYDLASNGQEAVQKWRTGGFHLILMDIQMPVMDGIQATKEIRRLEHTNAKAGFPPMSPPLDDHSPGGSPPRTPSETSIDTRSTTSPYRSSVIIVALTASSLQSDRVAALAAGCNDFLTKPVSLIWLNSKIIEWGSIKALQMWADVRPEAVNTMTSGQAAQARNVAERLHVPKGRATPPLSRQPSMKRSTPPNILPPSTSGPGASNLPGNTNVMPAPSTSPVFRNPDRPSSTTFWGNSDPPSAETLNELAKDLAQGGRRGSSGLLASAVARVASGSQSDDKHEPGTPTEEGPEEASLPARLPETYPSHQ
ncbi:hypothetical protein BDZ94DRAFT_1256728 [Collybia nuda]|uniref:Response regulatory domain-containing protein n=1 Tax=Collybia nuda TaxID=64659 RepID=A0A9P6CFL7_9AGAR|nr:hypothetical protein BDZ94DRAFT_1256728 [Collybia nuda]